MMFILIAIALATLGILMIEFSLPTDDEWEMGAEHPLLSHTHINNEKEDT